MISKVFEMFHRDISVNDFKSVYRNYFLPQIIIFSVMISGVLECSCNDFRCVKNVFWNDFKVFGQDKLFLANVLIYFEMYSGYFD